LNSTFISCIVFFISSIYLFEFSLNWVTGLFVLCLSSFICLYTSSYNSVIIFIIDF
jgi:hypothetical protein